MRTVTLNNAISDLAEIIAATLRNKEETVIATDNGSVVMIDQEDWEGILETLKLSKKQKSF